MDFNLDLHMEFELDDAVKLTILTAQTLITYVCVCVCVRERECVC
jgi:hypothetical protein